MNEAFEKADEAFAKANEAFASVDWKSCRPESSPGQKADPTIQNRHEFEAPTLAHRRKLASTFFKMTWEMLWNGKTTLVVKKRK